MRKKITVAFLSLMFVFTAFFTVACKKDKDPEKPTAPVASVLVNDATTKLDSAILNVTNGFNSKNSNALGAPIVGYEDSRGAIDGYFMMAHLLNYVIHGLGNNFTYGVTYKDADVDVPLEGNVYIKGVVGTDKSLDLLYMIETQEGEVVGRLNHLTFLVKITYSESINSADKIGIVASNLAYDGSISNFTASEYDFANNKFMGIGFECDADEWGADIVNDFNNGTLNFDRLKEYDPYPFNMYMGNLATNVVDFEYKRYDYWPTNPAVFEESVIEDFYNNIYGSMKKYSAPTSVSVIDKVNTTPIDNAEDAYRYGYNKANIANVKDSLGNTKYYPTWTSLTAMKSYIQIAKQQLNAQQNASATNKQMLQDAYSYLSSIDEKKFTGQTGLTTTTVVSFEMVDDELVKHYTIVSQDQRHFVTFVMFDGGVAFTRDYTITNKFVYDSAINAINELISKNPSDTAAQDLKTTLEIVKDSTELFNLEQGEFHIPYGAEFLEIYFRQFSYGITFKLDVNGILVVAID